MTYKPRNRNKRASRDHYSWSEAFDDHVSRRRNETAPCGFRTRDEVKP